MLVYFLPGCSGFRQGLACHTFPIENVAVFFAIRRFQNIIHFISCTGYECLYFSDLHQIYSFTMYSIGYANNLVQHGERRKPVSSIC